MRDTGGDDPVAGSADGRSTAPSAAVQSVDRAVTVLEVLARRGEAGVTEIATALGVHKSTAFRLVAVLENRGLVEQSVDRGKYRLGFGLVRLAGAASAQLDLAKESRVVCGRLAGDLGETVNVAIIDGLTVLNVSQVRGTAAVVTHNWVGQRTPLHATSSGKALLAHQPDDVRERIIGAGLRRYTDRTIVEPGPLRAELAATRDRGWACTEEEFERGLNAVAVPVRGADGSVVAAVSASGPSYRLGPERFDEVARALQGGADEIGTRVGYAGGPSE